MVKLAPSLAAAPMHNLGLLMRELEQAGADMIHFDIEDGSFVPVITLGTRIISEMRPLTSLPFDAHLMIDRPEWLIPELAKMGVASVSVHYEACPYPRRTLKIITDCGLKAGLAFNPRTPIPKLEFCLPYLSYVVVLTTEPEAGDSAYLPAVLEKMRVTRKEQDLPGVSWMIDGGITPCNIGQAARAGADVIVAGRSVFKDNTINANIAALKNGV